MEVSILGPPQSGKSTLLGALSRERIPSHHGEDHVERVIKKKDERLSVLSNAYRSKKTTYPTITFREIVTLKGGKKGSINQRVKLSDAIVVVFRNENYLENLKDEFVIHDLMILEKRIETLEKEKKKGKKIDENELAALSKLKEELEKGSVPYVEGYNAALVRNFQLLSFKPFIPVLNTDSYEEFCWDDRRKVWVANLDLEREILLSEDQEKASLMKEFGIEKLFVEELPDILYRELGLITFFTVGEKEAKAWTIKEGTRAIEAAGKVHSDMQKGFIRAEVYSFSDFVKHGMSEKALREKGLIRVEGKDYIIKDGDVIHFRFNI